MDKKICIIHFNTPVLTHCLVRSINRYTPGATIYIFDNSDKKPFINTFDNVTVLDNTKGELLNFDEILSKYPSRLKSRGKTNNYGSAKHSMSIQKCIELINDNFILLDSDVLLKRDITPVFNNNYVWVAGVEDWTNKTLVGAKKRKRVCPFLMYVNVKKMNELGITFYDDEHMLGFNNGPKCEEYETGVWFYEATPKQYRRIINYNDYILHFRAGSWLEDARTKQRYKQIDPMKWLQKHQKYWIMDGEKLTADWPKRILLPSCEQGEKKNLGIQFNLFFDHVYCLHYLPSTDRLAKMQEEFKRIGIDVNEEYFSWVYDYPTPLLDLVYSDKRVNMAVPLKSSSRSYIKRVSMKHYEIVKEAYSLGYDRILVLEDDVRFYNNPEYINELLTNMPDTNVVMFDKMVCSAPSEGIKYKKYIKSLPEGSLYGDIKESGVFFIFCSCYSLDRVGMEHIIKAHENSLLPPDTPFNDKEITGSFAIVNLAIQDPKLKTRKVETYSKISLDTSKYGTPDSTVSGQRPVQLVAKNISAVTQIKIKRDKKVTGVQFRTKPNIHAKQKIEVVSLSNKLVEKPAQKSTGPAFSKRVVLPDKRTTRTRTIHAKAASYNKLYDV